MKIGELAKRTGLAPSTIRFYESKGLLQAVSRQLNGYREYPPEAVMVLGIINSAQQTVFSLDEIKQILPADLSNWQHDQLISALEKKVADIEAMEARLKESKTQLVELIHYINNKPEGMDCADNAKRLLEEFGRDL